MATIGSLVVNFKANTGKFNAGIKAANQNMRSFERRSRRTGRVAAQAFANARRNAFALAKSISPLGPLMAGGLAAGFIAATKAALSSADAIAKTADAAGLSTDALQGLRFQASQTGVGAEALDKALLKFNKTLGEAKDGTGTLITILRKSDPVLLQRLLRTRDQAEALRLLADAIKNESDGSRAAALANAAFGRQGARLVKTFKSGAIGIDEFLKRAREAGIVIREDLLRGAEAANDKMDQLARTLKSSLTVALVNLAPQIKSVTESLIKSLPPLLRLIQRISALAPGVQLSPVDKASLAFFDKQAQLARNQRALDDLLAKKAASNSNTFNAAIKFRTALIEKLKAELEVKRQLLAVQQALAPKAPTSPPAQNLPARAAARPATAAASASARQKPFGFPAFAQLQSVAASLQPQLQAAQAIFNSLQSPMQRYQQQLQQINALQKGGFFANLGGNLTATRARVRAILDMADATGNVAQAMRDLQALGPVLDPAQMAQAVTALQRMDPALQRIQQRNADIARTLAFAVGSANSLAGAFRNVRGAVVQVARQLLIINPLTRVFQNILNGPGLIGRIFGAGANNPATAMQAAIATGGVTAGATMQGSVAAGGVAAGSSISAALIASGQKTAASIAAACANCACKGGGGGVLKKLGSGAQIAAFLAQNLPGRAAGGPVRAGAAYLVGERGPEIFRPNVSGAIIPRGTGAAITINIDARGAVSEQTVRGIVEDGLRAAAPEIIKTVEGRAVARARAAGGR